AWQASATQLVARAPCLRQRLQFNPLGRDSVVVSLQSARPYGAAQFEFGGQGSNYPRLAATPQPPAISISGGGQKQGIAMAIKVSDDIARAFAANGGHFQTYRNGMTTRYVDPNNKRAVAEAKADIKKRHADASTAAAVAKGKSKPSKWVIRERLRIRELEEA